MSSKLQGKPFPFPIADAALEIKSTTITYQAFEETTPLVEHPLGFKQLGETTFFVDALSLIRTIGDKTKHRWINQHVDGSSIVDTLMWGSNRGDQ